MEFNNTTPVYLQIVEKIKLDIFSGKLSLGDKLPSVREYAVAFEVNPNTMQRALAELEDEHLIYTERTTGKFVTTDFDVVNRIREDYVRAIAKDFFVKIGEIGLDKNQIIQIIKEE